MMCGLFQVLSVFREDGLKIQDMGSKASAGNKNQSLTEQPEEKNIPESSSLFNFEKMVIISCNDVDKKYLLNIHQPFIPSRCIKA